MRRPLPVRERQFERESEISKLLADYFDSPFSFTLITFLCDGSSLLIESLSLVVPFLVGAKVTVLHATALHTFHSRELNRDFETIWFGTLPGHETAPAAAPRETIPALVS